MRALEAEEAVRSLLDFFSDIQRQADKSKEAAEGNIIMPAKIAALVHRGGPEE